MNKEKVTELICEYLEKSLSDKTFDSSKIKEYKNKVLYTSGASAACPYCLFSEEQSSFQPLALVNNAYVCPKCRQQFNVSGLFSSL